MKMLLAALIFLAMPLAAASAEEFVCAHKIETTQKLKAAPEGWSACRDPNDQIFESITLFEDEPKAGASIGPTEEAGGMMIWSFKEKKEHTIWMQCNYRQTAMRLSRPLPKTITKCSYSAGTVSNVLKCE
jgi:hypothetical protein